MNDGNGMKRRDFIRLVGGMGGAMALGDITRVPFAFAKAAYPVSKINYIVGYPPGGGNDLMARGIALYIKKHLQLVSPSSDKVGVVIKNVPAGSGLKALNDIFHARPDGYTIAHGDDILHTRSVLGELGFDPFSLTFIARIASNTKVLLTGAKSNIHTWDDVVKASKASPIRIGCAAFGTSNHVATVLLLDATKLDAKTVFFGGTPNVNAALIRRDIPLALNNEDSVRDLINATELRHVLSFLMADKEFLAWSEKKELGFNPVYGAELDALLKNVQGFYKSKEKLLREALKS